MNHHNLKQYLSVLLAVCMLLSMMPATVFAEEGETENGEPALAHEHSYAATVTEPTCTEQGYTIYTC